MACFFCGFEGNAVFRQAHFCKAPAIFVCRGCALRIGGLLLYVPTTALAEIWSVDAGELETVIPKKVLAERRTRLGRVVTEESEMSEVRAHLDLATAYRDMGLLLDAAREAGMVLLAPTKPEFFPAALDILLSPPLLREGGLRALMFRMKASNPRLS